jgi:hypothetical protein
MILDTLSAAAGVAPTLWDAMSRSQNMRVNMNGVRIAYRYEARANLDLIGELKLENLKDSSISDSSFRNFIENLQTRIGAVMRYDTGRQFYADFTKSLNGIKASMGCAPESDHDTPDPVDMAA